MVIALTINEIDCGNFNEPFIIYEIYQILS